VPNWKTPGVFHATGIFLGEIFSAGTRNLTNRLPHALTGVVIMCMVKLPKKKIFVHFLPIKIIVTK
jgi:hypothetical protein